MEQGALVYFTILVVPVVLGLLLGLWLFAFLAPRQRRRDDLGGQLGWPR